MTQTALFVAVNSRCVHGLILTGNEKGCQICKYEAYLLSKKPPFEVTCIDNTSLPLTKNSKYKVLVVVRRGESELGDARSGFILESIVTKGLCSPRIYPASCFSLESE